MLGSIHRGTPWQTIYMKASDLNITNFPVPLTTATAWTNFYPNAANTWIKWSGNTNPNEAFLTRPVEDRILFDVFAIAFDDPHQLLSVNNPNTNSWLGVLDGLTVLTNNLTDVQLMSMNPQFDTFVMESNSPQAAFIANAINAARSGQPSHYFRGLGDILIVPELSDASPWLNRSTGKQLQKGITDEAYEIIPSQLLARLRPDSIGSLVQTGGVMKIQFSGFDNYPYAIQVSSNLQNWDVIGTNYPANGIFELIASPTTGTDRRFFRSVLLP